MSKYDTAVVGAGLGGLAVAALLARKKKKVIVVERGESLNDAAGVMARDGFTFFAAPTLSYGFEKGGAFHDLHERLGIAQAVDLSPCYQVVLPDRRVTVYPQQGETLEEIRREFPKDILAVERLYRDLRRRSIRNAKSRLSEYASRSRSAEGFIRKYRFSREFTTFLNTQSFFFYRKPAAELSLSALISLCDTHPQQIHGGFENLADQLCSVILKHGSEVVFREQFTDLRIKHHHVIGIKTTNREIEADTILDNSMPREQRPVLFLGIQNTVVPVSMCNDVIYLPDYTQPLDIIALSLNPETGNVAPPNMRTLSVSFLSPQPEEADSGHQVRRISQLIPFLSDYLVLATQCRSGDGGIDSKTSIAFKPLVSFNGIPMLARGSKKNIYKLNNQISSPLQVILAVQKALKKLS